MPGGIVRRLDHVNVVVTDPRGLFDVLTRRLELPVAWPFTRFRGFTSGAAALGVNYESLIYANGRRTSVPPQAGLYALAFEPEPLAAALAELPRRGIPHTAPMPQRAPYPVEASTPVLPYAGEHGERRPLWTLVLLGGFFASVATAREFARWPQRGDGFGAGFLGKLAGRMMGGPLADLLTARFIPADPFVFLCDYQAFAFGAGRRAARAELERRDGGPLGLVRTREVVVTASDPAAESDRWQRFLDPILPSEPGLWQVGDGPAIRVVEGAADRIGELVWEIRSLPPAHDWLRREDWLGGERDGELRISPEPLQGLDVRLVEPDSS